MGGGGDQETSIGVIQPNPELEEDRPESPQEYRREHSPASDLRI